MYYPSDETTMKMLRFSLLHDSPDCIVAPAPKPQVSSDYSRFDQEIEDDFLSLYFNHFHSNTTSSSLSQVQNNGMAMDIAEHPIGALDLEPRPMRESSPRDNPTTQQHVIVTHLTKI